MSSSNPEPVCPHCGSTKVTFLEHGSGVIVFRCENCARATIQRWTAHAAAQARGDAIARDVLGHENMGEVVEVGGAVEKLTKGDRAKRMAASR